MGGSLNKRLFFTCNYDDYETYCFKEKMSAPKSLIDSKAWCPLSFLLEILSLITGIQDENTKIKIKAKNYPKSKSLRKLESLIYFEHDVFVKRLAIVTKRRRRDRAVKPCSKYIEDSNSGEYKCTGERKALR